MIHSGRKDFQCEVCKRSLQKSLYWNSICWLTPKKALWVQYLQEEKFSLKCNLNTHVGIHTGEFRYDVYDLQIDQQGEAF